jgi:hypothetical protein
VGLGRVEGWFWGGFGGGFRVGGFREGLGFRVLGFGWGLGVGTY